MPQCGADGPLWRGSPLAFRIVTTVGIPPRAKEKADDGDRVRAGFFACLGSRREDWARRMLRSAHVLKDAGNVDWLTFAETAKVPLDGRALEMIPITENVWQRTNMVLVNEVLLRGRE